MCNLMIFFISCICFLNYQIYASQTTTNTELESRNVLRLRINDSDSTNKKVDCSNFENEKQKSMKEILRIAREKVSNEFSDEKEISLEEINTWIEINIRPAVLEILENNPEISSTLETSGRLDIRLDDSNTSQNLEDNPILMIIDRWRDQTAEDAFIAAILNPSAINMHFGQVNLTHNELIRVALSARFGNLLSLHDIGLWAFHNRPDTSGRRENTKTSDQEELLEHILGIYKEKAQNIRDFGLSDYQRRSLLLCMRDFQPGFSMDTTDEFTQDLQSQDCDSRLLFQIGTTSSDQDNNLFKSRKSGFLRARYDHSRFLKEKRVRFQELQKMKKQIELSKKRAFDTDELEKTENQVEESIRQLENPKTKRFVKPHIEKSQADIQKTACHLLTIIKS